MNQGNKHTPGPWKIVTDVKTAINAQSKHIAMVNWRRSGNPAVDVFGDEHEANARLIATAPDLLEVLEIAESTFEDLEQTREYCAPKKIREIIRATIAQAKGES